VISCRLLRRPMQLAVYVCSERFVIQMTTFMLHAHHHNGPYASRAAFTSLLKLFLNIRLAMFSLDFTVPSATPRVPAICE